MDHLLINLHAPSLKGTLDEILQKFYKVLILLTKSEFKIEKNTINKPTEVNKKLTTLPISGQ